MKIQLVDGTYELFRNHFGAPPKQAPDGRQVGATLGLVRSLLMLVTTPGVTHVACAFDHVIESFRNDLFAGYKTGAGVDPDLLAQFPLAEEAVAALGVVVWPMIEFEADDALASAVKRFKSSQSVEQIVLCSPDKDLAQLVSGSRIVCWDRRRDLIQDEAGVVEKFGVRPASIPDWLALVGDAADGYPGIAGWGAKSSSAVLARYEHIEKIPDDAGQWQVPAISAGRAASLAASLAQGREAALLYRKLATLRYDVPLLERLSDLKWQGAHSRLKDLCRALGDERIADRVPRWQQEMPAQQNTLFTLAPDGFLYKPDLLPLGEEQALAAQIAVLPLKEFEFHGYLGKRRVISYGWHYDFGEQKVRPADEIPAFLHALRERAAFFAGLAAADLPHALITEYSPGAAIGWHRDKGVFEEVIGISLLSPCIFRFRRKAGPKWERYSLTVEPRSAYLLRGPSRTEWEHSIPGVEMLRYSITFRSLRPRPTPS